MNNTKMAQDNTVVPITINPGLDTRSQMQQVIKALLQTGIKTEDIEQYLLELRELGSQMPAIEEIGETKKEMEETAKNVQTAVGIPESDIGEIAMGNTKIYNLKKAQEALPPMDPMGLPDPEIRGDQLEMENNVPQWEETPAFQDGGDLKDWLDQKDATSARNELLNYVASSEIQETIEDSLNTYYEGELSSNQRLKLAAGIFELLPDNLKKHDVTDTGTLITPYISGCMEEIDKIIRKAAWNYVVTKDKKFNLKKIAQHKSFENTFMWGPDQVRLDPFYRQPVSDWHIVERNKGFGLTIDDIWNIDYESLWRNTIMDKYSRPYRDKEGKWVGGYIEKRFEVDKNIPEASNYQLKPGQKRKSRPPEYGVIEGRLQDARAKGEVEGSPVVEDIEPFNWKEAQSKKKR